MLKYGIYSDLDVYFHVTFKGRTLSWLHIPKCIYGMLFANPSNPGLLPHEIFPYCMTYASSIKVSYHAPWYNSAHARIGGMEWRPMQRIEHMLHIPAGPTNRLLTESVKSYIIRVVSGIDIIQPWAQSFTQVLQITLLDCIQYRPMCRLLHTDMAMR